MSLALDGSRETEGHRPVVWPAEARADESERRERLEREVADLVAQRRATSASPARLECLLRGVLGYAAEDRESWDWAKRQFETLLPCLDRLGPPAATVPPGELAVATLVVESTRSLATHNQAGFARLVAWIVVGLLSQNSRDPLTGTLVGWSLATLRARSGLWLQGWTDEQTVAVLRAAGPTLGGGPQKWHAALEECIRLWAAAPVGQLAAGEPARLLSLVLGLWVRSGGRAIWTEIALRALERCEALPVVLAGYPTALLARLLEWAWSASKPGLATALVGELNARQIGSDDDTMSLQTVRRRLVSRLPDEEWPEKATG